MKTIHPMLLSESVSINTNLDLDQLLGGIVSIIIKMALYVGIVLAVGGVFSLVLAYKDDNSDAQAKAVRVIVVGGALIGLRALLGLAGIVR